MHWVRHFQELTQKASGQFISGSIQHYYKMSKQPLLLQTNMHIASFDIDVLDPSEAPATGTRVRGGLTLRWNSSHEEP